MKRFIVLIACAVLLTACAQQATEDAGSLTLSPIQARAIAGESQGDYRVRYSLSRNGYPIPINGQKVLEIGNSDTIQIDNLFPSSGYSLTVSVGLRVNGIFKVRYYGNSSSFAIAEDSTTSVTMNLAQAPSFNYLTDSGRPSSAAILGDILYVLDGNDLKSFKEGVSPTSEYLGSSFTVNSLSLGKYFEGTTIADELWLNTSAGIYRKAPGSESYASNMTGGLAPNVTSSGAIELPGDIIFGVYSGGGKTLGMVIADEQADFTSNWYTLEKGMKEYSDVKEIVESISRDIITSIAVNEDQTSANGFYYVATPLGTLIGSEALKKVGDGASADKNAIISKLTDFWLEIPGKTIKVVSTAGDRVYAAPAVGVYTASVNTDASKGSPGKPLSGLGLVSGTESMSVSSLASVLREGVTVTAAITTGNSVAIIKGGSLYTVLDAACGIPTNAQATFRFASGSLHLIITGGNGAIDYIVP